MDWKYWMAEAYKEAVRSPDRSTQNGAIVLWGEMPISWGWNRFAIGVDPHDERVHQNPLKYKLMVHAERAAMYALSRSHGLRVTSLNEDKVATMVCPWAPCPECAQAIIECGIKRLVVHKDRLDQTPDRWRLDVDLGLKMCRDAGVEVVTLEGPVDAGITIRFDGKDILV